MFKVDDVDNLRKNQEAILQTANVSGGMTRKDKRESAFDHTT